MDKHNEPNNDINNSNKLTANTAMLTANTAIAIASFRAGIKNIFRRDEHASINKNNIKK